MRSNLATKKKPEQMRKGHFFEQINSIPMGPIPLYTKKPIIGNSGNFADLVTRHCYRLFLGLVATLQRKRIPSPKKILATR